MKTSKPTKSSLDPSSVLAKYARNKGHVCKACSEPHASKLNLLLDHVIKTGEEVTIKQLWLSLKEWTGYPCGRNMLQKHFAEHQAEKFMKVNLYQRGRVG